MREVLISIQPKWVEKIASGEKTVEVRKTRPNCEVPFKCYIYETQGRTETPWVDEEGHYIFKGRGKVIGEFVCDRIDEFVNLPLSLFAPIGTLEQTCLTTEQIREYLKGKRGYGWHITDLIVYDEPRELSDFATVCDGEDAYKCSECEYFNLLEKGISIYKCLCNHLKPLKRPPQSWCYIEPRQTAD